MGKKIITGNNYFYLLFCVSLALTWFFHKDATRFNDRSELWSDRAGYYIYLPATFYYHFDTRQMPADLDIQTGGGFSIDTLNNKIDTKYTYGVALLASPFFLASGLISEIAGYDTENGLSMLFMRMMSLAAVVYLILGLWFLKKFLDHYFLPAVSFFVITLIFLGTNLFYYALIDGMMSHVYSFFLFALFLFALKRFLDSSSLRWFILLCITLSLVVLIRPTNIIIGLLFFTLDAASPAEWRNRLRQCLKPSQILVFLAILFVLILPQLIYWKYLSGNWIHFSYRGEGFTNWSNPRILEVLFSPVNGLLTYTPLALFFIGGIILMIFRKKQNGWLMAGFFILVTLLCASWKMWYFGCSYGQRSYIEYFTILAVPFGYLTAAIFKARRIWLSAALFFFLFLFTYFNLRLTSSLYRYERCYYGSTWDWDHYFRTISRAGIFSPVQQPRTYENDFENLALSPVNKPSTIFTRSGQYSIAASDSSGKTPLFNIRLGDFGNPQPKRMEVEVWALKPGLLTTGASLDYTLNRGSEIIFSDKQSIDSLLKHPMTWTKICKTFIIPDVNDSSLQIRIFIRNPKHILLFIDDLKIQYQYRWNSNRISSIYGSDSKLKDPPSDIQIFKADLTKIIHTDFSNPQLAWIIFALAIGLMSILLFLRGKIGCSVVFLFLAGLILRMVTASLDPFLWTWDEQFHALVAKNMVLNPFKPMLISAPALDFDFRNWQENNIWLHKQPFFLWQIAFFFKIFGTSEFVLRMPTVIMMSLMILLIYRIGKLVSSPSIAWYGAFIYTFSFYFVQFVSGYKFTDHNDSAFIFYVTLSIWSWVEYIHSNKKHWLILIGLFAGIAILNKWLVGLLVYSGWSLAIFLCNSRREWYSEHKKMAISFFVTIMVALPWQIFILMAYPAESRFEFIYNSRHFFEPLEGHGETWYYHFSLLSEQYGGALVWFLIIPGLYYFYKSMLNRVYQVGLFTWLIVTYLFFTLAATKTPMFCAIVSPILFLGLGAILDKIIETVRWFTKARLSSWIITLFLAFLAFETLDINRLDMWHSEKLPDWKSKRINGIIHKEVARKLSSKEWVVFNCGTNNAAMFMFYSGNTAYDYYPDQAQHLMLKSKGIRMATFVDENIPDYLKQDTAVRKFYLKCP